MPDVFSSKKRSQIMAGIKGRDNKATELAMTALFRRHHIVGWRRRAQVFGKPDLVFPKRRLALFVDGCFWHSCPTHASRPDTNEAFWSAKLRRNKERDRLVTRTLKQRGWHVLRVWQHELSRKNERFLVRRILRAIAHENG
jgi:DNA mismatch endonuclease (patch repair protein)